MVAYALEIVRNLECRGDLAEISRERLLKREELEGLLVDHDLEPVDPLVRLTDLRGERLISGQEGGRRSTEKLLGLARHLDQLPLEVLQPIVELPPGGFGHRSCRRGWGLGMRESAVP